MKKRERRKRSEEVQRISEIKIIITKDLIPGIKMNIDGTEDCKESVLGAFPDGLLVLLVIIEDTCIDAFSTGTVFVDVTPFIRTVDKRRVVSWVIKSLDIDSLPVVGRRTILSAGTVRDFPAGERTSVLGTESCLIITPWDHFEPGITDRNPVIIGNRRIRRFPFITVNDRNDVMLE